MLKKEKKSKFVELFFIFYNLLIERFKYWMCYLKILKDRTFTNILLFVLK